MWTATVLCKESFFRLHCPEALSPRISPSRQKDCTSLFKIPLLLNGKVMCWMNTHLQSEKKIIVIKTHSRYITDENCEQTEKHSAKETGTCLQKFGSNVVFPPFVLFYLSFFSSSLFLFSSFLSSFFLSSPSFYSFPVCACLHAYILSRKQARNNLRLQTKFPQCF